VTPVPLLAHGVPGQADLPIPIGMFLIAGAAIVLVSFALLAGLWKRPRWADLTARPIGAAWLAGRALRLVVAAVTFILFAVALGAALSGSDDTNRNIAPLMVLVVWWIGLVPLALLAGAAWPRVNPWRSIAAVAGDSERDAPLEPGSPGLRDGSWLDRAGVWPAYGVLVVFAWLELVYFLGSHLRVLGAAMLVYTVIVVGAMLTWGARRTLMQIEGFSVYSSLLATMSPWTRAADGRLAVRPPFLGALTVRPVPGLVPFVTLLIGSVSYDGLTQTGWWNRRVGTATARLSELGASVEMGRLIFATFGLALLVLLAWGAFELASVIAGRLGGFVPAPGAPRVAEQFAGTLLPIAVAYVVAHYFSLFVLQGPDILRLMSDPFGQGWNLFGTAGSTIRPWTPSANTIWYVQVGAIVVGHVIALVLAHERAITLARTAGAAVRSQLAMLALMVLYTVGGLYFLSEGLS
jgi:hypothetical protein